MRTNSANISRKAHPANSKPQVTLIQKSQIFNPRLDEDNQKILNSIIEDIKNCPPPKSKRKYEKGDGSHLTFINSMKKGSNSSSKSNNSEQNSPIAMDCLNALLQFPDDQTEIKNSQFSILAEQGAAKVQQQCKSTKGHNDEDKSAHKNHTKINNQSQIQTPVTKEVKKADARQTRPIKPTAGNKKIFGQGNAKTVKKNQVIILQSDEQIVEVTTKDISKKKAELELIMRYQQKMSINFESSDPSRIQEGTKTATTAQTGQTEVQQKQQSSIKT